MTAHILAINVTGLDPYGFMSRVYFCFVISTICLLVPSVSTANYSVQSVTADSFDATSTNVVWTNDTSQTNYPGDDDYQLVNIGFTFYLGPAAYTQVRIIGNGALHFGSDQGFHKDYTNEALPITGDCGGQGVSCPGFEEPGDRLILGYWDDLEPSQGGTTTYDTLGTAPNRRFAVTWSGVPRFGNAGSSYTFQMVIYESGDIRFRYGNDDVTGSSATIGIEVDDSNYTQFSFNSGSAVSESVDLLWSPAFPALSSATALCTDLNTVTLVFDDDVSPLLANDASNFTLDNGATVVSASLTSANTVTLATSTLSSTTTYTVSTSAPVQSRSFTPSLGTSAITYRDNFGTSSYGNSDGTGAWAGNWIEDEESTGGSGPSAGNVTISSGRLRLDDRPNSGGEPALIREVDLSQATSATLSFDYATSNNLENSDRFDVSVSTNGGNFVTLAAYSNDVNGTANISLNAYLAASVRIRFRIENNYGGFNEAMFIDNVEIAEQRAVDCPLSAIDHFRVVHDNNAINCRAESITIIAEDSSNGAVTDYTGSIDLSTSTGTGTWALQTGSGSFTDATDDDGAASYTYVDADNGTVVLTLTNTRQESLNIGVSNGTEVDEDSEGLLTFRPVGFEIAPNPVPTQIAGRPFTVTLSAVGELPSDPGCNVIEEYTGNKNIRFWSSYDEPSTGSVAVDVDGSTIATSEAASIDQVLAFTDGRASFDIRYADAGRISLGVKDQTGIGDPVAGTGTELYGGLSPFVVRPFAFYISVADSPSSSDSDGGVFRRADQGFEVTLSAVIWESGDDATINGDLANNDIAPNFGQHGPSVVTRLTHQLQAPVGGNGGTLSGGGDLTSFTSPGNGQKGVTLSWSEVGIIQLDVLSADYLSSGEDVTGMRDNVGRFIPDHFSFNTLLQSAACGSFTYGGYADGSSAGLDRSGQEYGVSGVLRAENSSNLLTLNYTGDYAKIAANNISATARTASGVDSGTLGFGLSSSELTGSNGLFSFNDTDTQYQFASPSAPVNILLRFLATDSDGVTTSGNFDSNAVEKRLGRLRMENSYGPETVNLNLPLFIEYFDGAEYQLNTQDNCTYYSASVMGLASYTENLSAGETGVIAPLVDTSVISGLSDPTAPVVLSAPGVGNEGSVTVDMVLDAQPWLRFDRDGDGLIEDPQGLITFGRFRGSDRVIHWQER